MPFINTKVNISLSSEKKDALAARYGKASSIIGKSESWLMLGFEDNCSLYFRGDGSEPTAYVDVNLYGGRSASFSAFTAEISKILNEELGISPDRIYVKYSPTPDWGWNGGNF